MFGSLSAYEMRKISVETSKREVAFNSTKKQKQDVAFEEDEDSDSVLANFVRKLKKGSGKYKCKLPFKCFICGYQ